ncbi:dienelactone hydrolase family protein [Ravibacter arvi]|uniref:Dienelactone hydrolase family protein n=1 Tax=Ravibacter arvi TaxID=2051041 RepID=A0ABP8LYI1_9BACT
MKSPFFASRQPLLHFLLIWVLVAGTVVPSAAQEADQFEAKKYTAKNGVELPYRVLLPENFDPSKRYPLLLFLHGSGERGNDNKAQLVHGSALFLQKRADFPAIVVFPQCAKEGYWASAKIDRNQPKYKFAYDYVTRGETPQLAAVMELVKELDKLYKIDRKRRYIMGLSMGGMGTFEAISRHPGVFAAAIPICGGGDTTQVRKFSRKLPLWVFHGSEDNVVHADFSRSMVKAIEAAGGKVKYTEYPGLNHNSWDKAFSEPELLPWLFAQKRK